MLKIIKDNQIWVAVGVLVVVAAVAFWLWGANNSATDTSRAVEAQLAAQREEQLSVQMESGSSTPNNPGSDGAGTWRNYQKPSDAVLQDELTQMEYYVTQNDGTEVPYQNDLWDETRDGIYVDILSGEPLFSSENKYKSGTGWPSWTKPLEPDNITTQKDTLLGYTRIEVRSRYGDNHLGHVFNDGPTETPESGAEATGLRYCLNSAALEFIPADELEERGYGQYTSLFE